MVSSVKSEPNPAGASRSRSNLLLLLFSDSEDPSRIFVAVGYGFFVEMTHDEALRFIDKKTTQLTASVHHHRTGSVTAGSSSVVLYLH